MREHPPPHHAHGTVMMLILLVVIPAFGSEPQLPWLRDIGAQEQVSRIHTVSGKATVSVSDGLSYSAWSVFHDPQRAMFRRVYTDRTITQGVEGKYRWVFDGRRETEGPPFVEEFVLGHQFHSQILFFDRLHPRFTRPKAARFQGKECQALTSDPEGPVRTFYYLPGGRPLGMESMRNNGSPITVVFHDWRAVEGIELPFTVWIDDGERQFTYRYTEIMINEGSMAPFRADDQVLTEEQRLLRMHRRIMDDHFFGRSEGMRSMRADSVMVVAEGELYLSTGSESEERFEQMLRTRDYAVYDDLVRPIVKVSADGSQGWVIAQVSAKGVRFDAQGKVTGPLEFVSAWIEMYEKKDDRWRMVGNVSNFRPGRK